jgi:L-amino acid N-acyltransferase YncA
MSTLTAIRPAARDDLPQILEIYNEAVANTTASYDYEPRTLEHRTRWFEDHLKHDYPVVVAVSQQDPSRVLGWGSLSRFHDRAGYRFTAEDSIYIASQARGQGIGKQLLAPLIEGAHRRSFHAILAVIDASNEPSVRLHASFGFQKVAHLREVGYKFGRWLDVVYMELLCSDRS